MKTHRRDVLPWIVAVMIVLSATLAGVSLVHIGRAAADAQVRALAATSTALKSTTEYLLNP